VPSLAAAPPGYHKVSGIRIGTLVGLTHYRPAMPFANRKIYFRGSFEFSIFAISKISPLWKPEI